MSGPTLAEIFNSTSPDFDMVTPTRIDTRDKITDWLESVGAVDVSASVLNLRVPRTDEFSWSMVLGSGLRGALSGLDADAADDVRAGFLARLADEGIIEVDCDTLIAVARCAAD